jgi:hypothetical protein
MGPVGADDAAPSNRSHAPSNSVSAGRTRILKIGDQRLTPEIGSSRPKIRKIVRHRLCNVPLSIGNVAHFLAQWTWPTETGLAG